MVVKKKKRYGYQVIVSGANEIVFVVEDEIDAYLFFNNRMRYKTQAKFQFDQQNVDSLIRNRVVNKS